MGIPANYSRELPERRLYLIEQLLPQVEQTFLPGQEGVGPLTTTFLLAMATPIVVLPIERVERHRTAAEGYVDDRALSPELAFAVDAALGGRPVSKSPFFEIGKWRLARITHQPGQNLARYFPHALSETLRAKEAETAASAMCASEWASCIRNALAHGGIAYLDSNGHQTYGQKAEVLAFISGRYGSDPATPEQLRVLSIDEPSFLAFLRMWVAWLSNTGLSFELAA